MKKYKIRINDRNRFFIIKNKPVRTPVEFSAYENELSGIKTKIKNGGIINYLITEIGHVVENKEPSSKTHTLVIEELLEQKVNLLDFDNEELNVQKESLIEELTTDEEIDISVLERGGKKEKTLLNKILANELEYEDD